MGGPLLTAEYWGGGREGGREGGTKMHMHTHT